MDTFTCACGAVLPRTATRAESEAQFAIDFPNETLEGSQELCPDCFSDGMLSLELDRIEAEIRQPVLPA